MELNKNQLAQLVKLITNEDDRQQVLDLLKSFESAPAGDTKKVVAKKLVHQILTAGLKIGTSEAVKELLEFVRRLLHKEF